MRESSNRTRTTTVRGARDGYEGMYPVGTLVQAKFGGGTTFFSGIVVEVDDEQGYYRIIYTDGDSQKSKYDKVRLPVDDDLVDSKDTLLANAGK
jgi:hypothetical protein